MEISFVAALAGGLLSFFSPCVLPMVPAYISYMTGLSVDRMKSARADKKTEESLRPLLYSLFFVLGFSTVFVALGASASILGRFLLSNSTLLAKVGGGIIILFGLHYMGLFRIRILNLEARLNPKEKPPGIAGAYVMGLAFAFGWTPCIGPILAGILTLAGTQETLGEGITLLSVYSAGLGIPFILAGLAINKYFSFFSKIKAHFRKVEIVSGSLLIVVGAMIITGEFARLSVWMLEMFPGWVSIG